MALLAYRLALFISTLIHPDQAGFIPGRGTHDCIRKVLMMLEDANETGGVLGLASLDTEKAFDRVEWE